MDINQQQKCNLCGDNFTVQGILDLAEHYWPELDVLVCRSPCCQKPQELQLKAGVIERGYVYAAGAPHFAGMEVYIAPNLHVSRSGRAISFHLGGSVVTINAKT
ncbi:hypothetical protein ACONUD_07390 [Microbulbifer harenosus]|uniref:Uncharacterized protein n=1 Tax=Microbulbifer harenosus TaxID=2576840 RepID=A0ABY2UCJ4_9GAMM|nr:hypothetical protein [Microbulbifer harenosus]TLM73381.1 hypothetical protein FDY93_19075 [Microbulbifer harenosus]